MVGSSQEGDPVMKVVEYTGSSERTILTAMIVHSGVLGRIASKWEKEGMFKSDWSNIVARWCIAYWKQFRKAPKQRIQNIFASWAEEKSTDKETHRMVEKYLSSISAEYTKLKKGINQELILDMAGKYFNDVRAEKAADYIQGCIDSGKSQDAWKKIESLRRVNIGVGAGFDIMNDLSEIDEVVDPNQNQVLFRYPGALGEFYGDSLEREGFLAFLGPEKRGKTNHLIDLSWRGMLKRCRVAFFEIGDLSKRQIKARLYARALGRPIKPTRRPYNYPKALTRMGEGDDATLEVTPEEREHKDWATRKDIEKAFRKIRNERIRDDGSYFRVSVHPNSSINVSGIRDVLEEWSTDAWRPDIVVIDYADIMAPPTGFRGESRDAVNDNWKGMRRMSQELHCLVVTATQANAASYQTETLGMQHFSEDKRKFAHVTGMIGINQSETEKKQGIQKLNWLVLREDEFFTSDFVYVAGCMNLSNPCIRSAK
jgi:hypothetical protein